MSRLSLFGQEDGPPRREPDPNAPILRQNRRGGPLHPEEIARRLRERAARATAGVGPTPYGWLVLLYPEGEKRIVRKTDVNATYEDACALRDRELAWAGPCDAWIVAKRVPDQKTLRP